VALPLNGDEIRLRRVGQCEHGFERCPNFSDLAISAQIGFDNISRPLTERCIGPIDFGLSSRSRSPQGSDQDDR